MNNRFLIDLLIYSFISLNILSTATVLAQIVPDSSLGKESSIVTPNTAVKDALVDLIEGGAIRGDNLFHSFSEFNVSQGSKVFFASPDGIANILTRVTGNSISNIFGTLGVDGVANLFLLNPNGIVFGENANLDLNGSFLATTADSYSFGNGFEYSANNNNAPPLLTIKIPMGLQFGAKEGQIINRSRFSNNDNFIQGLNISSQQTLSLIGGEVLLEGGYVSTSAGNIEIGSVAPNNQVNLNTKANNWRTDYQGITSFADLRIDRNGGINGGEIGGSNITLTGKNISLGYDLATVSDLSYQLADFFTLQPLTNIDRLPADLVQIIANNQNNPHASQISINASDTFSMIKQGDILANTTATGKGGAIAISADAIVLYSAGLGSNTEKGSSGDAGTITFNANHMSVQNGGAGVNTSGIGNGGKIDLNIVNNLKIKSGGFGADTFFNGNGGTIEIDADNLEIISGGAGVNTLGEGNGGTIDLNIVNDLQIQFGGFGADTVSTGNGGIIEINAKNINISSGGLGVNARNVGKGGQINLKAESIVLENARIGAESGQNIDNRDFDSNQLQEKFGRKNAGDGGLIFIEANSLILNNGGQITTSTFGTGNAGEIDLTVNNLELQGDDTTNILSSTQAFGDGGNIQITADDLIISDRASIAANSNYTGDAGNIFVNAQNLIQLKDSGSISVDGGIKGRSGNINLQTDRINLSQQSSISARVNRGDRGNITLTADNIVLNDHSKIATNATATSAGGNIFINVTDNLVIMSNSQLIASAVAGQGGNIQIKAQGIVSSFYSKIDASSEFGIDGNVKIDTFSVNLNSGLVQFPEKPLDPSIYLTQGCSSQGNHNFVNIGRGGLPENLLNTNQVEDATLLPDLEIPQSNQFLAHQPQNALNNQNSDDNHLIIEAQTWTLNQRGNLELIAVSNPNNSFLDRHNCQSNIKPENF